MNTNLLYIANTRDPLLLAGLSGDGQRVTAAELEDAERALKRGGYAFILLDLAQLRPELLDLCVAHRGGAEVLVLLADSDRHARIKTLRAGADMCLSRPLSLLELQARMEALSRDHRGDSAAAAEQLWLSNSRLLLGRGTGLGSVAVTVTEQRLLILLARHPGAMSREAIEQAIWGSTDASRSTLIERHICNLRRKLAQLDWPHALQTLRGFGYCLSEHVELRVD
jgi:DNA-binding response OmpR family regulator